MSIDFLTDIFKENPAADAIIWHDSHFSYSWLLDNVESWNSKLSENNVSPGQVVLLEGDFSPNCAALLLSLIARNAIIIPLSAAAKSDRDKFIGIGQAEFIVNVDDRDSVEVEGINKTATHALYENLRQNNHPGLVLFSSGSTGESKAAVHDFHSLLQKYMTKRHKLRTVAFLLFDHIGGIDTFFYSLSNGSCVITLTERSPDNVCAVIERHKAEVLPVSPTFLNLLILSEAYKRYDLSSLKYITYGTEVMPNATLKKCAEIFPDTIILQKYGTTEVGTLRSKSQNSQSTWVKIGGEGYQTRIVDGILHIKARSAMLGYLNAPSPFTEDGWFNTGDAVEVDGEYIKILGRKSEIINVGGEKVFPTEVENVIQQMDNIAEVVVYGEKNPVVGNIVCAKVTPLRAEDPKALAARLKKFCRERLQSFKVPIKVEIVGHKQYSSRYKKIRATE